MWVIARFSPLEWYPLTHALVDDAPCHEHGPSPGAAAATTPHCPVHNDCDNPKHQPKKWSKRIHRIEHENDEENEDVQVICSSQVAEETLPTASQQQLNPKREEEVRVGQKSRIHEFQTYSNSSGDSFCSCRKKRQLTVVVNHRGDSAMTTEPFVGLPRVRPALDLLENIVTASFDPPADRDEFQCNYNDEDPGREVNDGQDTAGVEEEEGEEGENRDRETTAVAAVSLSLLRHTHNETELLSSTNDFTLSNSFWFMIGTLMGGSDLNPKVIHHHINRLCCSRCRISFGLVEYPLAFNNA